MALRDTEVLGDFFGRVADEDAMLLGRVTYQEWADYWPTSTNEPFASHINSVPKHVISQSLDAAPWGQYENATLVKSDLADAITDLKQQPGKNIGVHGSPTLVEGLLQADLLDEMRLEIYPVLRATEHACSRTAAHRNDSASPIRSSPLGGRGLDLSTRT